MKTTGHHHRALWLSLASLLAIIILMLSTDPVNKIIYAVLFFALALVFMVSSGYLLIRAQKGEVGRKDRLRVIIVSLIILILLMFRSAQSLNWVDALILLLICFGAGFYISRRA